MWNLWSKPVSPFTPVVLWATEFSLANIFLLLSFSVFVQHYISSQVLFSSNISVKLISVSALITRRFRMLAINRSQRTKATLITLFLTAASFHLPCFFTPTAFSRSLLLSQSFSYRLVNNLLKRQSVITVKYRHSCRFSRNTETVCFPKGFLQHFRSLEPRSSIIYSSL